VRGVQCEIRRAVYTQVNDKLYRNKLAWLRDWSALMHFTFSFNTAASFNPGVSLITPNPTSPTGVDICDFRRGFGV